MKQPFVTKSLKKVEGKSLYRNSTRYFCVLGFCLILIVALLSYAYVKILGTTVQNETQDYLQKITLQKKNELSFAVNENLSKLSMIAKIIDSNSLSENELKKHSSTLNNSKNELNFLSMFISGADGVCYSTDNRQFSLAGEQFFRNVLTGEKQVSSILRFLEDEPVLVYAVPIFNEHGVCGALGGFQAVTKITEILKLDLFEKTYIEIVASNGAIVVDSPKAKNEIQFNLFSRFDDVKLLNDESKQNIEKKFSEQASGCILYKKNNENFYLTYTPLEFNNWIVVMNISEEEANVRTGNFINGTVTLLWVCSIIFVFGIFCVIWRQERMRKRLYKLAYYDDLTGGENLKRLEDFVTYKLQTDTKNSFCLVYANIVKFKLINDKFGYDIGNQTLIDVYELMKESLFQDEMTARVSADNFLLFMETKSNEDTITRLRAIMGKINYYGRQKLDNTSIIFKIGIYNITDRQMQFSQIMDRADMAQQTLANRGEYETKYVFYDEKTRSTLKHEYAIQQKMQTALDNREFLVYLQPKYNIQMNCLMGAEALVRWHDKEKGILDPEMFISLFEYNGFVVKIDRFVFRQVCRYIRTWLDAGCQPGVISVNLSRAHFEIPDFIDEFEKIRQEYDVPAKYIELELTESLVFENMGLLFDLTEELHSLGYKCSLDDFGSGYSSLNILKNISVDVLKLDRGFFIGNYDERSMHVINGIINITRELGIKTVAEGVETESQIDFLKKIGCDAVQTFMYAKPMPINEYRVFAEKPRPMITAV